MTIALNFRILAGVLWKVFFIYLLSRCLGSKSMMNGLPKYVTRRENYCPVMDKGTADIDLLNRLMNELLSWGFL